MNESPKPPFFLTIIGQVGSNPTFYQLRWSPIIKDQTMFLSPHLGARSPHTLMFGFEGELLFSVAEALQKGMAHFLIQGKWRKGHRQESLKNFLVLQENGTFWKLTIKELTALRQPV